MKTRAGKSHSMSRKEPLPIVISMAIYSRSPKFLAIGKLGLLLLRKMAYILTEILRNNKTIASASAAIASSTFGPGSKKLKAILSLKLNTAFSRQNLGFH